MTPLLHALLGLGGAVSSASESLPLPTLFVAVYGMAWIGLVAWIAWLATRQHGLNRDVAAVQVELQSRLSQLDRRPPPSE